MMGGLVKRKQGPRDRRAEDRQCDEARGDDACGLHAAPGTKGCQELVTDTRH